MYLPDSQLRVLEQLARYRYLTVPQLQRLGVSPAATHIRDVLRELERYQLIKRIRYGVLPGAGRLPDVAYLTKAGATLWAEFAAVEPEEVYYPKQHGNPFKRDYFHRHACIDFQIELDAFAADTGEIPFYHQYFHKEGANRGGAGTRLTAMTKVRAHNRTLIPDSIFRFNVTDDQDWLFAVEVKNGFDTKAVLDQIEGHISAIQHEAIERAFDFPDRPVRVLVVFSEYWKGAERVSGENPMHQALARLAEKRQLQEYYPYFAFSTLERVRADFLRSWHFVRGDGRIERPLRGLFDVPA